jgi:hypothetical protein
MAKKVSRSTTESQADVPNDATTPKPRTRARSTRSAGGANIAPNAAADASATAVTAPGAATAELNAPAVSMASEPSEDEIRLRAYHRYLERGGGHGMDFEDWLHARQDLMKK